MNGGPITEAGCERLMKAFFQYIIFDLEHCHDTHPNFRSAITALRSSKLVQYSGVDPIALLERLKLYEYTWPREKLYSYITPQFKALDDLSAGERRVKAMKFFLNNRIVYAASLSGAGELIKRNLYKVAEMCKDYHKNLTDALTQVDYYEEYSDNGERKTKELSRDKLFERLKEFGLKEEDILDHLYKMKRYVDRGYRIIMPNGNIFYAER